MEQPVYTQYFWEERERLLPLPTHDDSYIRVLLVGTTGAGKTTLVRQFLGTRPDERFPSTATAKTTTSDFEVILDQGLFKTVVTFLPQEKVSTYVEECIFAAVLAHFEGRTLQGIVNKLLEHTEQRFRLRYILGDFPAKIKNTTSKQDDEIGTPFVTSAEAQRFAEIIQHYLDTIQTLVENIREKVENELNILGNFDFENRDEHLHDVLKLILSQNTMYYALNRDILSAIRQRFSLLSKGELTTDLDDWPQSWRFESGNRDEFIKVINLLSSNYSRYFGKLLTPLVQGIRVAGPFHPIWKVDSAPRLVLIDGEGLGHTIETITSLSTRTTYLFDKVDAIVLVDNATLPMQAASLTVLETVVASGHAAKLFIAFTHFETVDGDSLPDRIAREEHVSNSLENVLAGVGQRMSQQAKQTLRRSLEGRIFFLSYLQEQIKETLYNDDDEKLQEVLHTKNGLLELTRLIESIDVPSTGKEIKPVYNERALFPCIQKAVKNFRERWQGLLKIKAISAILPEHWKRIQALTRRIGFWNEDEYDTLRPVADFIKELTEQIRYYLENPVRWEPKNEISEEILQTIIDPIAREFHNKLHALLRKLLIANPQLQWIAAYKHSGTGSTKVRAYDIDAIFKSTAPMLSERFQELSSEKVSFSPASAPDKIIADSEIDAFTLQIVEMLRTAIQSGGGRMVKI